MQIKSELRGYDSQSGPKSQYSEYSGIISASFFSCQAETCRAGEFISSSADGEITPGLCSIQLCETYYIAFSPHFNIIKRVDRQHRA